MHWTYLSWAFKQISCTHSLSSHHLYYKLAVFNPRPLLTSALLERNLHAFLRWGGIQTQAHYPSSTSPCTALGPGQQAELSADSLMDRSIWANLFFFFSPHTAKKWHSGTFYETQPCDFIVAQPVQSDLNMWRENTFSIYGVLLLCWPRNPGTNMLKC